MGASTERPHFMFEFVNAVETNVFRVRVVEDKVKGKLVYFDTDLPNDAVAVNDSGFFK